MGEVLLEPFALFAKHDYWEGYVDDDTLRRYTAVLGQDGGQASPERLFHGFCRHCMAAAHGPDTPQKNDELRAITEFIDRREDNGEVA